MRLRMITPASAYQGDYVQELIDETDYPSFDVEACQPGLLRSGRSTRRPGSWPSAINGYTSPMTGKQAPPHHTPWKDALDDSLESYLQTDKQAENA